MSFDWSEYLSLAEMLCGVAVSGQPAGVEAHQRAGVSRAYYAAFAAARNRLRDVDRVTIPLAVNPHWFVQQQYVSDPDPRRTLIGLELGRLRRARNLCDYEDTVPRLPALTQRSLGRAGRVLGELGRL